MWGICPLRAFKARSICFPDTWGWFITGKGRCCLQQGSIYGAAIVTGCAEVLHVWFNLFFFFPGCLWWQSNNSQNLLGWVWQEGTRNLKNPKQASSFCFITGFVYFPHEFSFTKKMTSSLPGLTSDRPELWLAWYLLLCHWADRRLSRLFSVRRDFAPPKPAGLQVLRLRGTELSFLYVFVKVELPCSVHVCLCVLLHSHKSTLRPLWAS